MVELEESLLNELPSPPPDLMDDFNSSNESMPLPPLFDEFLDRQMANTSNSLIDDIDFELFDGEEGVDVAIVDEDELDFTDADAAIDKMLDELNDFQTVGFLHVAF